LCKLYYHNSSVIYIKSDILPLLIGRVPRLKSMACALKASFTVGNKGNEERFVSLKLSTHNNISKDYMEELDGLGMWRIWVKRWGVWGFGWETGGKETTGET